jgi:phospholipid/cholesterol/gamma-HCH transport system ATP-binding protein
MVAEGEPIIRVRGLTTRFGPQVIHDRLELDVRRGEILALVGGSGTGKSVLLRTMIGLKRPEGGTVEIFGKDLWAAGVEDRRAIQHRWGVLFQNGALFSSLTVAQNIRVPLRENVKLPAKLVGDLIRVKISMVGLPSDAGAKYPSELSGGMRKRAALIRTLAYDPPVILMDEPFAAVDAQTRTQLQADLLTLWDLGRKTIIFVTHDTTEAIALGDRTLVLSRQPTRIAAEHAIPIPRPRNVQDIFALEGFAAVYQRIRSDIQ